MPYLWGLLREAPQINLVSKYLEELCVSSTAWSLWHWWLKWGKTPPGLGKASGERKAHGNMGSLLCCFSFPFLLEFLLSPWVFFLEHIWVSFCPQLDVGSILALSRFSWEQLRAETGPGRLLEVRTFTNLVYCISRGGKKDSNHKNNSLPCLVETNIFSSRTQPSLFI